MHPEICRIGPFTIYSYGLMLACAFLVACALAGQQARRKKINPELIFNFCFLVLSFGVIGARIFYVSTNLAYYLKNPLEMIMLQHGGLAWFGGLILGSLAGILYLKIKKIPVYPILDLIVPFLALGQAIGRIGCLLNGCCYGRAQALIPIQAYSSLALVLIFVILRFLQERPHRPGKIFYAYLLLYSIKRFSVEFWRIDNPQIFLGLTLFQILSICLFFLALIKLCRRNTM